MLAGTRALDDRVRSILVQSLYAQPSSLAIGALCGMATAQVAAYVAQSTPITVIGWIVTLVAMTRIGMAYALPRSHAGKTRVLEIAWEFGAYSYALALGMLAALCVYEIGRAHV